MYKVKTLVESLGQGYEKAVDNLDKRVNDMSPIKIKDIKEKVFPIGSNLDLNPSTYIERIVIYKEIGNYEGQKKVKGEIWKPGLATDLMELRHTGNLSKAICEALDDFYDNHGVKTVKELIEKPYGWFQSRGYKEKEWTELKNTFNRYDIKLYKKGYVVKD